MQTEVSKTKMVAATEQSKTEMVTLEVIRRVKHGEKEKEQFLEPGKRIEVTAHEAAELLKLSVEGQYDFSGESGKVEKKPRIYYFKLIREATPLDKLASIQNS